MANMNMNIHDIGPLEIGNTFKNPKFRERGRLKTFDRVVPMWNQDWFTEADYANDELDRFPTGAGFPGKANAVVVGACPGSNAAGSGLDFTPGFDPGLQVLGRITGLRALRSNPSRIMRDRVPTLIPA